MYWLFANGGCAGASICGGSGGAVAVIAAMAAAAAAAVAAMACLMVAYTCFQVCAVYVPPCVFC